MPAFDLALCLRLVGRAAIVFHVLCSQPICQLGRDVAGTIVAEQARLMDGPLSLPEIKSGRTGDAILPGAAWQ